jgi:hypothetical protein
MRGQLAVLGVIGGAMAGAQSRRAEGLAHIEAAKKAAGYGNAVLFDHTYSRLLVGAELPFGRIIPPDNSRDPARFVTQPVKMFDNLYYVRRPKPTLDLAGVDGQAVTLGGQTIRRYLTPGHTPGTLSMLIPVTDNGRAHLAALWGDTGMQYSAEEYAREAVRFRDVVAKAGADVILSTHPQLDNSAVKLPLVGKRRPGDPHPYVVGPQVVQNYLTVAHECATAATLMPEEYQGYLGRR